MGELRNLWVFGDRYLEPIEVINDRTQGINAAANYLLKKDYFSGDREEEMRKFVIANIREGIDKNHFRLLFGADFDDCFKEEFKMLTE